MKIARLYIAIPALAIILFNIFWGSVISWFLSIVIVASLAYYLFQINLENMIAAKVSNNPGSDEVKIKAAALIKKYKVIFSFVLMTIIFLGSIFCIEFTTNPGGDKPWFYNNDYYGISNNGIAFDRHLTLYAGKKDSSGAGKIVVADNGATASLRFSGFFEPVFSETGEDGHYTPVNNIFPTLITNDFSVSNGKNTLRVRLEQRNRGMLGFLGPQKEKVLYHIDISSNDAEFAEEENIPRPFKESLTIEDEALQEGKTLYNLFLDNDNDDVVKGETYHVLELVLRQLGETYLLANYDNEGRRQYSVFPSRSFLENGYSLTVNGAAVQPQLSVAVSVPYDKKFFVGFHNLNEKAYLTRVENREYGIGNSGTSLAFIFDYPAAYWLSGPAEEQRPGIKNLRFIANSNDDVLDSELKEGFLFKNYGLSSGARINGNLEYLSGIPSDSLSVGVTDNYNGNTYRKITNNRFSLLSSEPGVRYLFQLRDFSDNGFSHNRLLLFSAIIYTGFIILLLFFPGKNLVRIEPVIFAVIYGLLILRFILYWRLATFPPLENISKFELENTILNFDYNLGFRLPLPLTIIWVILFLVALALYRWYKNKNEDAGDPVAARWGLYTLKRINIAYAAFTGICFAIYILNDKVLHFEAWTRIGTILIPVIGYCYFATLSNRYFTFDKDWVRAADTRFFTRCKAYVHYFINNPAFVITLLTVAFFAVTDRGFAILFTLFILLKNVFLNFLKKPFDSERNTLGSMLFRPNNYWFYGIASLVVYLAVLSFKSLFYYLITYKLIVIWLLLFIPAAVCWLFYRSHKKLSYAFLLVTGIYTLLLLLPPSRNYMEAKATDAIRHVQYRASIIHQPISDLLLQNDYSSFQTKKIIETAENQWFINSYIRKQYDNTSVINLRPYSKVGVNYNTQTRDVVLARFVIGELGDFTMYLTLVLILMPLILYLMSYRLTAGDDYSRLSSRSYAGVLPLILLFTISLFVWLTATNRFVFFGQDFPFLSLTSKLSVVLPLALFAVVLMQQPESYRSYQLRLRSNLLRYLFFIALVAGFALTTVKSNELSNDNFSVVVEKTQGHIDNDLNAILIDIQDSIAARHKKITYPVLVRSLEQDARFRYLIKDSVNDAYTRSILKRLVEKPNSAFRVDNPLYMLYDNGRYAALYNQHLYLELPAIENRKVWHGTVSESLSDPYEAVNVTFNGNSSTANLPFYSNDPATGLMLAIMPVSWFINEPGNVGVLSLPGNLKDKAEIFIYNNSKSSITRSVPGYANSCRGDDVVSVNSGKSSFVTSFSNSGNHFALSKWVNGSYRILYPQRENNFWMYHFANTVKASYRGDSLMENNVAISLDYNLVNNVQDQIRDTYAGGTKNNNRFKFSVIAADGNGNIRLMADYVTNKRQLDPNDAATIYDLMQQHFFFSNVRNERDQWGNSNFLAMHLGPGSSIKPLIAAVIASQVNAGWENLYLAPPVMAEYNSYGGLKLNKPWKNDDHYRAGNISLPVYIEASSNFYQSVMMFLGSYPRSAYLNKGVASIRHVLAGNAGPNNVYPVLSYNNATCYLPNYSEKNRKWPATDPGTDKRSKVKGYFGNEHSILAEGLEINAGLRTGEKARYGDAPAAYTRVNITDTATYKLLVKNKSSSFLWSFPEQSDFLQSERSYPEPNQNFNIGLKTSALGGYPYRITPFKMLEMYLSLLTQNRNFSLHVTRKQDQVLPWITDSTWGGNRPFNKFLAANIFKGMNDVIYGGSGTAHAIGGLKATHPGFYFYAKTGTINEQGSGAKNSRRLMVGISNKDLQQAENIGRPDTKVYALYFVIDNNRDFDWKLLTDIINQTMASRSFQNYFQ